MSQSFLSRLAAYSLQPNRRSIENFTTEILAHLYNEDAAFRRGFVPLLAADKRQVRGLLRGRAETQVQFPRCIADIVLTGENGRRHFVEVKVDAQEMAEMEEGEVTKSQIDRYLDLGAGNVTFLTTRYTAGHRAETRGRRHRVHHALFEQLYSRIHKVRMSEIGSAFVRYMEEQGMAPSKPLTRQELRRSEASAVVHSKCLDLLVQFKQEVEQEFLDGLRTRGHLRTPIFSYGPDWAVYDCYVRGFRNRGPVRTAGFLLAPERDGMYFSVYVWGTRTHALKRLGRDLGWVEMGEGKGYETYIKLRGTEGDADRMKSLAIRSAKKLGRVIRNRF